MRVRGALPGQPCCPMHQLLRARPLLVAIHLVAHLRARRRHLHLCAIPALRHRAAIIIGGRAAPRPPCLLSAPGTTIFTRFQHGSHECHRGRETSVLEFSWCMHSGKNGAARFVQYGDCLGTLHPREERLPLHAARQWRREVDAPPPAFYPTRHTSASPPV